MSSYYHFMVCKENVLQIILFQCSYFSADAAHLRPYYKNLAEFQTTCNCYFWTQIIPKLPPLRNCLFKHVWTRSSWVYFQIQILEISPAHKDLHFVLRIATLILAEHIKWGKLLRNQVSRADYLLSVNKKLQNFVRWTHRGLCASALRNLIQ